MKTEHFIIKEDGNLYVIRELPKEPIGPFVNNDDCARETAIYMDSIKRAKVVKVLNPNDVLYRLVAPVDKDTIYALECEMEIDERPWYAANHLQGFQEVAIVKL